ncbi:MAG: geranylgeranyl reductase family protein [Gammaproteobacteria bacterium]
MNTQVSTDLFVAGLGPAGASAAAAAAAAGLAVVAVDRKEIAGMPIQCAEFVPSMLAPIENSVRLTRYQLIDAMQTFVENSDADWQDNFPGVMIDRARFDKELAAKAAADGAICHFNTPIKAVRRSGSIQLANGNEVHAKFIIGADGPRSRIGQAMGSINKELVVARQFSVPLLDSHSATDIFLSADYVGGYGWLFPRGDSANVGIGVTPNARSNLGSLLTNLHAKLVNDGRVGSEILSRTGGLIPVGGIVPLHARINNIPVLVCGDAAGLTNPITGAGICSAVISGRLAGESAANFLSGDVDAIDDYSEEIHALFGGAQQRGLRHRQTMLDWAQANHRPSPEQLRRTWITHPAYWAA